MCGRYASARPASELSQLFEARELPGFREAYQPSFNIAPTRTVAGLAMGDDGIRLLQAYRWGLVPGWATDISIGSRLFNARAETLDDRRAFSEAAVTRRMGVVADGFFEWRQEAGPRRAQPVFFHRADGQPLVFAGLWESWRNPADPHERLLSCTIITTAAGEDMAGVHDRMPATLMPHDFERWLHPGRLNRLAREELLRPAPPGTLVYHPVDPRVGDVRQDDSRLVVRYAAPTEPEPLRLFS